MKTLRLRNVIAQAALGPAWLILIVAYMGTVIWTIGISFTNSRILPVANFAGLRQYERLFGNSRWEVSVENVVIFGVLFISVCLILGFLLAIALDQHVRGENTLRTIILYPYAMSFIVTGVVWQWMMNPDLGIQSAIRALGWESFTFGLLIDRQTALYGIIIAAVWQASGLVMAILLAGLRGVDSNIWKASKIDGIPAWRVYMQVVLPILTPQVTTAVVLLSIGVVKAYDIIVAMTDGGPGISTEMPAKFVIDFIFDRTNLALASAGATMLFISVVTLVAPWLYVRYFRQGGYEGAR